MDAAEIRAGMAAVTADHGPWHSHNIHLGHGVWTRSDSELVENSRLRRYLQAVSDAAGGSLAGLRVLDLACEEGAFGIEMARQGAEAMAVEGRPGNVARARFAAEALGLRSYAVRQGDIRDLSAEADGVFDVVFSAGILYHLDAPDLFAHLASVKEMTGRFLFLSTHVARFGEARRDHRGRTYAGSVVEEHPRGAGPADRAANLRASLDNDASFWLTRPSLFNLLGDIGFSSVMEIEMPRELREHSPGSIVNLLAFAWPRVEVPRADSAGDDPPARWPERGREPVHPAQSLRGLIGQKLRRRRR